MFALTDWQQVTRLRMVPTVATEYLVRKARWATSGRKDIQAGWAIEERSVCRA